MKELEVITVKYYRLFVVTFPTDDRNSKVEGYFTSQEEADKVASLKRGWYGGTGSTYIKDFDSTKGLPVYYKSADEWAKDKLTYNEYIKFSN